MNSSDLYAYSPYSRGALKPKNHQSPITKLTNLDSSNLYQKPGRNDGAVFEKGCQGLTGKSPLGDRSNEIFIPKTASKYMEGSVEKV